MSAAVHPLVSPWGRFGLYSYFIDAPEPAIVDTGIASSPAEGLLPALQQLGRSIEDVRWILLTHGHIDHLGGAQALHDLTGGKAKVVIHEADAPLLRSRQAHVDEYVQGRSRYLNAPDGAQQQAQTAQAVISGEMEPAVLVRGGETLSLGGDVRVKVHAVPGHTPGSVAYQLDDAVFAGDAVQIHGAANRFPGYTDPDAYRSSLAYLRDEVRPERLYLGHPYRGADGEPYGVELDAAQARRALDESLALEARIRGSVTRCLEAGLAATDSVYSPFEPVAAELGYTSDPTLEPSPFFTTLDGYRSRFTQ
ncbi:MBL fold metallo-hydrolase [Arthrobacter sp. Edens01]|uniref:MBL fold metallo-hydrolase n=1 Tax=Arthrobacter sp. Edens01 TaxID=1732020 RepID=UPI0006DBD3BD|nr:MBL fold metallo-hydrolase [Arthrobacter sp. Edens01]KPN16230.1 MBL fold metallo-hydrolase [Arthrobacter sp. Edens01]